MNKEREAKLITRRSFLRSGLFAAGSVLLGRQEERRDLTPTQLPELVDPPPGFFVLSPVEKKEYLEQARISEYVIDFFLPNEEPIRAVFDGKVTYVEKNIQPLPDWSPFNSIHLERDDGKFSVSYVSTGEVLVEKDEKVVEGQTLAKAGRKGLNFRIGFPKLHLMIVDRQQNNKFVRLSKEIFWLEVFRIYTPLLLQTFNKK